MLIVYILHYTKTKQINNKKKQNEKQTNASTNQQSRQLVFVIEQQKEATLYNPINKIPSLTIQINPN